MVPGALAYSWLGFAGRQAITGGQGLIRDGLIALALLAAVAFLPRLVARLRREENGGAYGDREDGEKKGGTGETGKDKDTRGKTGTRKYPNRGRYSGHLRRKFSSIMRGARKCWTDSKWRYAF